MAATGCKQQQKALCDATNNQNVTANSNITTEENDWQELILEYYRTKEKSIAIFLKEKGKSQHRDKFDKRWHRSGLKSLKEKTNLGRQKAAIVYNQWLESKEIAEKRSKTITESVWRGYILSYYI